MNEKASDAKAPILVEGQIGSTPLSPIIVKGQIGSIPLSPVEIKWRKCAVLHCRRKMLTHLSKDVNVYCANCRDEFRRVRCPHPQCGRLHDGWPNCVYCSAVCMNVTANAVFPTLATDRPPRLDAESRPWAEQTSEERIAVADRLAKYRCSYCAKPTSSDWFYRSDMAKYGKTFEFERYHNGFAVESGSRLYFCSRRCRHEAYCQALEQHGHDQVQDTLSTDSKQQLWPNVQQPEPSVKQLDTGNPRRWETVSSHATVPGASAALSSNALDMTSMHPIGPFAYNHFQPLFPVYPVYPLSMPLSVSTVPPRVDSTPTREMVPLLSSATHTSNVPSIVAPVAKKVLLLLDSSAGRSIYSTTAAAAAPFGTPSPPVSLTTFVKPHK